MGRALRRTRSRAGAKAGIIRSVWLAGIAVAWLLGMPTTQAVAQEPTVTTPPVSVTGPEAKPLSEGHELGPPATEGERPTTGRSLSVESTPLEDLLLKKGVITRDDWVLIKAEEERRQLDRATEKQFSSSPRWFERININGYAQFRYTMKSNAKLDNPQGESFSQGREQDFFFRRIRLVFEGQVSDRVGFFMQFANEGDGFATRNNEMVDMYGDYYITKDKINRFRFGLHRVPDSFDTYRSSSQRQELDRAEAVQSGAPGERDLGLAYYWTPKIAQERFTRLATYHNGPGDYGVFGVMVYNGQGRNQVDLNKNKHIGAKLAYPFELPNGRLVEAGVLGFMGRYVVNNTAAISSTTATTRCRNNVVNTSGATNGCPIDENRITGYIWTPPQPWGFMGEYVIGRGPQRNNQGIVEQRALWGGYAQVNYSWRYSDIGMLTPYIRYGYYNGGFKNNTAAAANNQMWYFGTVWEPDTHLRLVTEWITESRLTQVGMRFGQPQQEVNGNMLRFQVQWFWN